MTRMIDDYLLAVSRNEQSKGVLYPLINGLYEHHQKISIRNEEGVIDLRSFGNGLLRVTVLCLESTITWPVLALALLVEAVVGVFLLPAADHVKFNTFVEGHAQVLFGTLCAAVHFTLGEIAALYLFATESLAEGAES